LQADTVVDISHESLIRQWVKLRQWAREEYESAETYRDIERSAKQWNNGFHNLLTKLDLAEALNWRNEERPNATWAQRYGDAFGLTMDFIRRSERHRFWRRALVTVAVGLPVMLVALAFLLSIYVTAHLMAALPYQNPADEFSDLGVPAQTELRQESEIGADTPKSIPRGKVIDTLGLKLAKKHNSLEGAPFLLINALDTFTTIPGSIVIPYAGHPGDFNDDIQRKLGDELKERTANNPDMPLVFYCSGAHCWHSYNACLRAINLGYTRVYWYRGGLLAWFNIHAIDVKDLDLTRIEVNSSTVLKDTPEIIEIMGRVIGRVFRSAILGDHDQTVPLDDLMASSFHNRGFVYAKNGAYDQAIPEYDRAIEIDPKTAQFYVDRGQAYYYNHQYDSAIKDCDKAIELDPNDTIAYFYRGRAYREKRDYDRAIKNYDRAIELNPRFAFAYGDRALAQYRMGDYDRAIQDYGEAINLDRGRADWFAYRGRAYFAKGEEDRAIKQLTQSIELDSKNFSTYLYRGLAELYLNRADAAVNDLVTAVKLAPSYHYSVIWLHIARLRAGRSDPQELVKNAEKLDKAKWPWQVVSLFLGSSSPEVVRAAAEDAGSPDTKREQVCEADLYLGIYQQERDANDKAGQLFESAKEACPRAFLEYFAANYELQRLRALSVKEFKN
jgi:lipoprotein NlpI/rhodanese-related sulfurtransferase